MKAGKLMVTDLVTLRPTQGLEAAARILNERRIKGAPVVDEEGRMVGIVSKDDILAATYREEDVPLSPDVDRLFSSGFAATSTKSHRDLRVEDIMTHDVVTAKAEDAVEEICTLMVNHRIHRIPVVDENENLKGMVSASDVLKAVAEGVCKFR
jgi:CBS domain-containing protein